MYCGAGTGCWARRATEGVGWFACPGVRRAPIVIKAKTSKPAFTNELRNCIARSPVEEFFAANQAGGSQDSVIKRAQKTSRAGLWSQIMIISQLVTGDVFHLAFANKDTRHFQRRVG